MMGKTKKTSACAVWVAFGNPLNQEGTSYLVFGSRYNLIPKHEDGLASSRSIFGWSPKQVVVGSPKSIRLITNTAEAPA